jgi:hypothetical protein
LRERKGEKKERYVNLILRLPRLILRRGKRDEALCSLPPPLSLSLSHFLLHPICRRQRRRQRREERGKTLAGASSSSFSSIAAVVVAVAAAD